MKTYGRKVLSLVLAVALLVTCCISGLVLPAAAETAVEMFPNGDFEGFGEATPVIAPWTAHNSATENWTIREGAGVDGSWGLELTGTLHGTYVKFPTKPTFEDGATYRLSFRAKVDPTRKGGPNAGYVQLYTTTGLTYINKSTATVYLKSSTVAGHWITYYTDFTAAEVDGKVPSIDASWGMYVRGVAKGVCFDDFSLKKIEDNTEREILMDGDFENGADSAFFGSSLNEGYTIATREGVAHLGEDPADATNRVLVLEASEAGWTSAYFRGLHAEAGKSYVFSFDYKGGGFTMFSNTVYSNYNADKVQTLAFAQKDAWTHAEVIINSLTDASQWLSSFEKRNGNEKADTYIDNVSLKEYKGAELTGIALNSTTATVDEGATVALTVTAQPDGASLPTVTWASDDETVATVANGVVTGVKAGTATITAKAGDFTATCTVTVKAVTIPATSIELNAATATVAVGESVTLNVTAKPDGAVMPMVTWASSDTGVALVTDGVVTGVKAGTATITATADGLAPVTCEVTVNSSDGNVIVNGNFELGASVAWGNSEYVQSGVGKDGSWGLKSERPATNGDWDSGKGVYYKLPLFSTLKTNTKYTLSFDYKNEGAGQGQVQLIPQIGTTLEGKVLSNIVLKSGDVDWTTYSVQFTTPDAFTVSDGYEITFRSYGKQGVTYFDNIKLIEAPAATAIVLDKTNVVVQEGKDFTLTPSTTPEFANVANAVWTSSDETVATVANGVVTGVKAGTATITVTAGTLTATCKVTVEADDGSLIVNGNFEQGAAVAWGGSEFVLDGIGKDGSWGLKSERPATNGDWDSGKGVYYKLPLFSTLKTNTKYTLSFDYKNEGAGQGQVQLIPQIGTTLEGKALSNIVLKSGDVDWTTYSVQFTTPDAFTVSDGYELTFRSYGKQGVTYFDNIKLIEAPAATAIVLDKTNVVVQEGKDFTLSLSTTPEFANVANAVWTSSDETIATVANGVVTGVKAGTATITVTAGTLTATCKVTVEADDGSLIVNGNFEQGAAVAWGGSEFVLDGIGKDGTAGLKSERPATNGDWDSGKGAYYKLPLFSILKPNTKYTLSFDYKNEGAGQGQVQLVPQIGTTLDGKVLSSISLQSGDVDWTAYSVQFITPESLTVSQGWEATFRSYGKQGVTYFDNIKLIEAPAATAIVLDKTNVVVQEGKDFTLTPSTTPEFANVADAVWTSSDETVATVANGVVTGVKAGTATITVTAGTLSASCTVTVEPDDGNVIENGSFEQGAAVAWGGSDCVLDGVGKDGSVGLKSERPATNGAWDSGKGAYYKLPLFSILKPNTKYTLSFDYKNEGKGQGQVQLNPTIGTTPDGKTLNNIVLKTGDVDWTAYSVVFTTPESLTVSEGFEVTFRSYGEQGVTYYDNIKLIEAPAATAIALDKANAKVKEGKDFVLTLTTTPEVANVPNAVWTSSDNTVATVANGVVTGVKAGTATITVTAGTLSASCTVTVEADDGNLLENGDFEQGANVAWGGNAAVQNGVGKDGTVGIKLTTDMAEGATAHQQPTVWYKGDFVTLLEPDAVYELTVDVKHEGQGFGAHLTMMMLGTLENGKAFNGAVELAKGDTEWQTVTITFSTPSELPAPSKGYEWNLCQVHYAGAVGTGAVYYDNAKLIKVGKVDFADEITIAPDELELLPNESGTLKVMTTPAGTATGVLTWESSDPSVATVDAKGTVTAGAANGEAIITVTNNKGKTDTAKVVVRDDANLLKNGDFEQGGEYWGNIDRIVAGIGKDGSYGLKLVGENKSVYYKSSLAAMKPNTKYIMTFDYLNSTGATWRFWSAAFGTDFKKLPKLETDGNWHSATVIFTTPADMPLSSGWDFAIVSDVEGRTPVCLDNLCLRKYDTGVAVEKLTLSESAITIIPGRTAALSPYAEPAEGDLNDMTWASDNHNVAIVEHGVVVGVGKGTATITATTKNGKTATCVVTVSGGDTLVKNPTFDMEEQVWALEGGAVIADGEGRLGSDALKLTKDAAASQTVSGLKPATTYQLRVNARTDGGAATIKLTDGETVLFVDVTAASKTWKETVFEFTTPDTVSGTATLTLSMANAGPVYIDNVILNVKASLVDFVVSDLFWVGADYQTTPGTEVTFAVTVVNEGEDPVKAGSVVAVDICKNGEVITTLTQTLEADMVTDGSIVMSAEEPWVTEKGHWVISARANPQLTILEMNDVNNTTQKQLRVDDEILTAPEQALGLDMTELTFSDEFDSLESIDQLASGKDGYKWYVTRNWGAGTVQPDDYSIEDGVVTLKAKKAGFNITLSTIDVNTHNGYTWNKGYLEVRLRIPYANPEFEGGSPAVWSFPDGKWLDIPGETNHWVEMDWMEYWGIRNTIPGGYYTTALHETTQGVEGKKDHWFTNRNASLEGLGDEQWHTMGWLWVENAVIGYLDGVENFRFTFGADKIPDQGVTVRSGDPDAFGAYEIINEQFNALFIGGGHENPMEVDYVHIWQTRGETPTLPETPEGEEGEDQLIDVDAFTWWYNYCTDVYGDNITEVTYDNFLTVLGAESVDSEYTAQTLWNQLTEESKDAINAMLLENGQPTYDELLAAALAMAERVKGGWTPDDDLGGEGDAPAQPDEDGSEDVKPDDEESEGDAKPDDEESEGDVNPEGNAPTGAKTVLPIVLAAVLVLCVVLMFVLRKRSK